MKFRFFIFLVLFFSVFDVFATTQAAAMAACQASITGSGCSLQCISDSAGRDIVVLANHAGGCAGGVFPFGSLSPADQCISGTGTGTNIVSGHYCPYTTASNSNQQFVQCGVECPPPTIICNSGLILSAGLCVSPPPPPKVCPAGQVNDPANDQNCIPAPAKVCPSGQVNDPSNNQNCIPAPSKVCPPGQVNDPVNNQNCVLVPRPSYCGPGFQWDGLNCSMATSKTSSVVPAPTVSTPNPVSSPSSVAALTQTSSVPNGDGTITNVTTVTNADGSKNITVTVSPQAGSSPNSQGTGACNSGDSCNQSEIKSSLKSIDASGKSMDSTLKSIDSSDKSILQKLTDFFKSDGSDVAVTNADNAYSSAMSKSTDSGVSAMNKDNDFFKDSVFNQASDWLPSLPTSSCYGTLDIVFTTHWGSVDYHQSPCDKFSDFRAMMSWVLYIYSAFSLVKIIFK